MKVQSAAAEPGRSLPFDLRRGTNQSGVRLYNERLVLSLVRRHGSLSKAEIARLTGLSAQTVSVIMRQLADDGLLIKEQPKRGKIGQPSVPLSLNPAGAFFIGLKLGRRSSDLVLVDFVGAVRQAVHETYSYPIPSRTLDFVERGIRTLTAHLGAAEQRRIAGLGIAAPFELWNWSEQVGAPQEVLDGWRGFDASAEIARLAPWQVYSCNDATAACGAELVLGNPHHCLDFLYVFIGSFVGGGVVLNGSLYPGRTGNAGALGSLPVPGGGAAGASPPQQLIRSASIYVLEERLAAAGRDSTLLWRNPDDWGDVGPLLGDWIEEVTASLAQAVVSALSVLDFEAVIVDGAFPSAVRATIVARTAEKIGAFDLQGLSPVAVLEGTIGIRARAIGGACLPLLANFTRDREVLFRAA